MPITIGTNVSSLRAQRALGSASQSLSSTFERLSSGQRINKASDDAAGLAIVSSLNVDSRVYGQAVRNVNDGLSLLNIADSAMSGLSSIVIRIRELASQAANGTYSSKQRQALDQEAQALSDEFTRIIQSTKFNAQGIFDGSLSDGLRVQAGYGVDGSIQSTLGKGLGTGSFGARVTYATETSGSGTAGSYASNLGDVNGDGILDLVTAGYAWNGSSFQGQASVLLGRGDGTFGNRITFATDTSKELFGKSRALTLGDVNGDGILDLVTAGVTDEGSYNQGQASVLLGRGDGTFTSKLTFATETSWSGGGRSTAVDLGDINGDGILDLVTAGYAHNGSSYQGQASVLLGRGDGTFGSKVTFATQTSASGTALSWALNLGDVNGDGILDLVTAGYAWNGSRAQGEASVLLGRGDGSFESKLTFATETSASSSAKSNALNLGDVNGDGILDLVTAGFGRNGLSVQGQASVLLGRGDGSFADKLTFATQTSSGGDNTLALNLGDVNGDGLLDLVTAGHAWNGSSYQGQASVLLGRGDGTFENKLTFAADTSGSGRATSWSLTLGDVNGDGILDLATAGEAFNGSSYQGQASVLLGTAREGIAPILEFSLRTMADARQAMGLLDTKLNLLSTARGQIGAFQSRLGVTGQLLPVARENFNAAASRIIDADVADESSRLVRLQILQQAGGAVLAQANQQPALALRLLSS